MWAQQALVWCDLSQRSKMIMFMYMQTLLNIAV